MQISLKAARVNAHLLQREAAEKIGVNTSTLVSWENGKTAPKAPLLKKLCEIYGVSINEIKLYATSIKLCGGSSQFGTSSKQSNHRKLFPVRKG